LTTLSQVHARSAQQVIAGCRELVNFPLREAVGSLPATLRMIVGYHFGWHDEAGRPVETDGGKAIRPALALLAAEAVGAHARAAVPAAVAVELIHNFSLLHDDVMDGDLTRRHQPTAWAVFGVPAAILAGDALLNLAFGVLAGSSRPIAATRMLSSALNRLVEGQNADLVLEKRTAVSIQECVETAAGKTGALLGCACALGGLFAGGNHRQVECLAAFGEHLGLAFQHVDDLLGIWGDPAVTGKPVHSDLANRKKSLPVTAALVSGTSAAGELAALYAIDGPLTDTELAHAASLVEAAGGRQWSQLQAAEHLKTAQRLLAAGFEAGATDEMLTIARLITDRDY
jgi:geranylgeranyl diphosphate synthase, type I